MSYEESKLCLENNKKIIDNYINQKAEIDKRINELKKDVEMASTAKYKTGTI